ncbi:MAG TPA: hypothetical protein VJ375_17010 [Gaiellaceae bacterium]|nr:hypothetical protein [Gaiellaceae bacterium]
MPVVAQRLDECLELHAHPVDRGAEASDLVRKAIASLNREVAFADRLRRPRDPTETNGDQGRDDEAGNAADTDGKQSSLQKLVLDEP